MWYAKPSAGHEKHGQWLIISEITGTTVALVYTGKEQAEAIVEAHNARSYGDEAKEKHHSECEGDDYCLCGASARNARGKK